ncbi:MAG: HlyD family efflux transporter periplasmic adaptor subunit [Verrucomicrobia bacterium]|nr:HlyD family efflux transporter periplasmic adaptor subunit [Verrucomicrobiota bacterium]MBU4292372.1 HlyD family efflux transporter periplasmic adaptor subunit [Verrucomicrobiota bacterium]MBU4428576.1 HlyD family efflux transporter periplasmic adaptor subunit [Verrucomicrobiota bacterium]MCG2678595.1 efflux RND transporter periplasmic adaptor subunit [Kiritimatiellia bacterium]
MMRSKRFWGIIIAILAAGSAGWYYRYISANEAPTYQETRIERGDLKIMVMTTGTVQPQNRLEIKSPIAGRVEEALVKEGDKVRKGQILAWMSSTERAALLDAARAKGATELAYWEQLYKPTPLVAPLDGDIIARKIEPGQTVTASDVLYVMSDRLIIEAQVDETDIGRIAVGQPTDLTLDAYPQHVITGKVDQIAYEAKTVNNVTTYTVEVLPFAPPAFLRSGMTANLKVLTAVTNQVLLLPTEAVHMEKNQTVIWQSNPADKDKHLSVPVVTGLNDGRQTEILSGLQAGDVVLIKASKFASKNNDAKRNPFLPARRR